MVKWKPFDGDYANMGRIRALSRDSISALSERNMNSQDHVAIKELLLKGIDPHDRSKAPKSPAEMAEICFELKGGMLGGDYKTRERLGYHIINFAEGTKDRPTISVLDDGEGIEAARMEETILSLGKSTKGDLPFTHGTWGHGGSGSLLYCGEKRYTFIACRKHPSLQPDSPIGFTIVREVPVAQMVPYFKETYMEYLVGDDDKVLTVPTQEPQFPKEVKLSQSFRFGCWVKMFDYQLPEKGVISGKALKKYLDLLVVRPILPVRLTECRSSLYDVKGNESAYAYGVLNKYSEEPDVIKKIVPIDTKIGLKQKYGVRGIEVYVFQHKTALTALRKHKYKYTADEDKVRIPQNMDLVDKNRAVSFTVNGQVNFGVSQTRIETWTKFDSIAPYMLVHVDINRMPPGMRSKILTSSRQDKLDTDQYKELERLVFEELNANLELQDINEEYKVLDAQNATKPEQLERLIRKFSAIARVFREGGLRIKSAKRKRTKQTKFLGVDVPTFLIIHGTTLTEEVERGLPSDGSPSRVLLKTDAKNGYLTGGTGQLLTNDPKGLMVVTHQLHDGKLAISVRRDPAETIPDEGVLLTVAMTRPAKSPLSVSLRYRLYDPQEVGPRVIEIMPGAAMGTAPKSFSPEEFTIRVGYEVKWKNSDYEPHTFHIIDAEKDMLVTTLQNPIEPGTIGSWKPEDEGLFIYQDTNYPELFGLIHVLPKKENQEQSANPPKVIYVTQDGRPLEDVATVSWDDDGEWDHNKVVKLARPGHVSTMKINLDYIGFVDYRNTMKPKEYPKLQTVIGTYFVAAVCSADQQLYNYYKDKDDVPEDYANIIDSAAKGIADLLPTLMIDVNEDDLIDDS